MPCLKPRLPSVLFGLLALCALCSTGAAAAAADLPDSALQRVELQGPVASVDLATALAALHGLPLDAALLSQAEALVRDYYGWLEWEELAVTLAMPVEAPGLLRIAVQGQAPAAVAPAPPAQEDDAAPLLAAALPVPVPVPVPADYQSWLKSPARVLVVAAERRLYLKDRSKVRSYTVAVGTERTPTPPGVYRVREISHKPTWYPTPSIRREHAARGILLPTVIPPGRGNPLGDWFVRLQDSIGIHGTDQPGSIGQASSYGCIRMRDRDIAELVRRLRRGDQVVVINQDAGLTLSLHQ
jgi:lipoprotein-anchoring transpeptidase ErfK/SrfK